MEDVVKVVDDEIRTIQQEISEATHLNKTEGSKTDLDAVKLSLYKLEEVRLYIQEHLTSKLVSTNSNVQTICPNCKLSMDNIACVNCVDQLISRTV